MKKSLVTFTASLIEKAPAVFIKFLDAEIDSASTQKNHEYLTDLVNARRELVKLTAKE